MVRLQVDSKRITLLELEGDAPRTVHVDRVPRRPMTPQPVEIEAREMEIGRQGRGIQCIEQEKRSRLEILTYPAASTFFKELFQTLVPPGSDHATSVNSKWPTVNLFFTLHRRVPGAPYRRNGRPGPRPGLRQLIGAASPGRRVQFRRYGRTHDADLRNRFSRPVTSPSAPTPTHAPNNQVAPWRQGERRTPAGLNPACHSSFYEPFSSSSAHLR